MDPPETHQQYDQFSGSPSDTPWPSNNVTEVYVDNDGGGDDKRFPVTVSGVGSNRGRAMEKLRPKPTTLQTFIRRRHEVIDDEHGHGHGHSHGRHPARNVDLTEDTINRSIEIFFGNLTNFGTFCNALDPTCHHHYGSDQYGAAAIEENQAYQKPSHNDATKYSKPKEEKAVSSQQVYPPGPPVAAPTDSSIYEISRPVCVPPVEYFSPYRLTAGEKHGEAPVASHHDQNDNIDDCKEDPVVVEKPPRPSGPSAAPAMNHAKEDDREFEAIPNPLNATVDPCAVKKLCLVGHPLTSFKGLNNFKKLHEAWITNCNIKNLCWQDFKGLKVLQRLYLFGGDISSIEPLHFENLKVLWLSNNKLTSLNFLTFGMPNLTELNVANNQITSLEAEDLFKCPCLQNVNVSGNPLCTIQDVEHINVIPNLKEFYLIDVSYGKCPVASFCESRSLLVNRLKHIQVLDGKELSTKERAGIEDYVKQRRVFYYASSVVCSNSHAAIRKTALQGAFKQLENLGSRIAELSTWSAKCLQADFQMTGLALFAKAKQQLPSDVAKIHTRLSSLRQWTRVVLRRFETIFRINRWEQEMEEWMKWVEFKSFGTIQAYIAHSVLDPETPKDKENMRATLHQLISALSCNRSWPRHTILKLETVIVMKDKGAEAGMEKIFEDNYARTNEPKFVPPPPEEDPYMMVLPSQAQTDLQQTSGFPFYGPPSVPTIRIVPTYVDPQYKPPSPAFPYPESVPGLPERSQPLLLFLVTRTGSANTPTDPLQYFNTLLFEKSRHYQEIRLTNCIWMATQLNAPLTAASKTERDAPHSFVFAIKVLPECVLAVAHGKECFGRHSEECLLFALRRPLCYCPAYILYLSHIPNDKKGSWHERVADDSDVTFGVEKMLHEINSRLLELGAAHRKQNAPYYLHRTHDGVKADLTAVTKLLLFSKQADSHMLTKSRNGAELLNISKFLGSNVAEIVTSLDLSSNKLGLAVGLEGLNNLKKLNLSYNNLTTLAGIHKLPNLKELKAGWNALRFFHSTLNTLTWACGQVQVLEILPNPFQDVRDFAHIPVLARESLQSLKRVDAWTAPFLIPTRHKISNSPELANIMCKMSTQMLMETWIGDNVVCMDFQGRCATNLDMLPLFPTPTTQRNGIQLNLADNYLTSSALNTSPIVQNAEWQALLVQLELQENAISNLDWMINHSLPHLRILNLSYNQIPDLEGLPHCCPNLFHLQISGNPIPCNLALLNPLQALRLLSTLDASKTPVSTHPDYAGYILKSLVNVQVLDGIPMIDWNTDENVNNLGGILSYDWLETHIGSKSWNTLTELSLPNCNLQKVEFPAGSLQKLLSLDLSGNALTSLSGLSSLPRLRVLCVANNRVTSLGDPCPSCHEKTVESQKALAESAPNSSRPSQPGSSKYQTTTSNTVAEMVAATTSILKTTHLKFTNSQSQNQLVRMDSMLSGRGERSRVHDSKTVFPNLEVLVLSHNGITSAEDLHLHALPSLRSVLLNCNKLKSLTGLDNLPTVKAIVLDNNHISHIPFTSMSGCKGLKYLHLEHNRITALPRFPNIHTLTSLHIGYNRIQSLTDLGSLAQLEIQELTLLGNPSCKADYWKGVVAELPQLNKLDGVNVLQMKGHCERENANANANAAAIASSETASETWEDVEELPPGFIPDGSLKIRPLRPKRFYTRPRNMANNDE